MKNLDLLSRRILVSGISISMILLCGSLFLFSLNTVTKANAETKAPFKIMNAEDRLTKVDIWPFGIVGGKGYWIEYNDNGWSFRSSDVSQWKSID